MKRFWPIIYIASAPLFIYGGYASVCDIPVSSDVDWVLIVIASVTMTIMPLGLFAFGLNHSKKARMARPSLDRHFFGWWNDTLQPLRVSVLMCALYAVGALAAFPGTTGQARMMIFLFVAVTVGIAIGERLVYCVYDSKIVQKDLQSQLNP